MAKIGYARVSSTGQSLEVQLSKLVAYGCAEPGGEIFQEKSPERIPTTERNFKPAFGTFERVTRLL